MTSCFISDICSRTLHLVIINTLLYVYPCSYLTRYLLRGNTKVTAAITLGRAAKVKGRKKPRRYANYMSERSVTIIKHPILFIFTDFCANFSLRDIGYFLLSHLLHLLILQLWSIGVHQFFSLVWFTVLYWSVLYHTEQGGLSRATAHF